MPFITTANILADRMPNLHNRGAAAREALRNEQIKASAYSFEVGMDPPYLKDWMWSRNGLWKKNQLDRPME
jgi:xylulose-5-phosphate/fructose-6-phosphate phosphoketolase